MSKVTAAARRIKLAGLLSPNFKPKDGIVQMYYNKNGFKLLDFLKVPLRDWYYMVTAFTQKREVTLMDAREAQAKYDTPGEFFDKYGFVLLQHKSAVKHWNDDMSNFDNDISNIYNGEVEKLLREEIYPNGHTVNGGKVNEVTGRNYVVRRGPGAGKTDISGDYAVGVHQDYGFGTEGVVENMFGADHQCAN